MFYIKTDDESLSLLSYKDLSIINHRGADVSDQARSQSDTFHSMCLFSLNKNRIDTDQDKDRQIGAHRECVYASVLTAYRSVAQPESEILHLASINCSALFISHSTNIGYLFQHQTINVVSLLDP